MTISSRTIREELDYCIQLCLKYGPFNDGVQYFPCCTLHNAIQWYLHYLNVCVLMQSK